MDVDSLKRCKKCKAYIDALFQAALTVWYFGARAEPDPLRCPADGMAHEFEDNEKEKTNEGLGGCCRT